LNDGLVYHSFGSLVQDFTLMSDPEAERKAKAARAKALVSQANLHRTTFLTSPIEHLLWHIEQG